MYSYVSPALINNIVKVYCIPDDRRRVYWCMCTSDCRQTLFSSQYVKKKIHKRCSGVRCDLSQVAYGFRSRRCDGRIQETEDLMVDGEAYGCVERFCYLGDTLDGDVGMVHADTARINNGWMKFRELLPFITSRAPQLVMKGRVYASCVRS